MKAKEHNTIIKTITSMTLILAVLSASCLDSESWLPTIILAVCVGYLLLFCIANCTEPRNNTEGDIWDESKAA